MKLLEDDNLALFEDEEGHVIVNNSSALGLLLNCPFCKKAMVFDFKKSIPINIILEDNAKFKIRQEKRKANKGDTKDE